MVPPTGNGTHSDLLVTVRVPGLFVVTEEDSNFSSEEPSTDIRHSRIDELG